MSAPGASRPVPVLCYHRVGGPVEFGVTRLGRRAFARQVAGLGKEGWRPLTLAEFERGHPGPDGSGRPVLLTFDDAYASLEAFALPLLADHGLPATLFVITDFVGLENRWDLPYGGRQRHLGWDALDRWRARGFDVGSHTATHPRLDWLSDQAALDELARSRAALVSRLGPEAGRALAYPFGRDSPRLAELARIAGYTLGFAMGAPGAGHRLRHPRTPVYVWDAGRIPLGLRGGLPGRVGRAAARWASRCAVGTSWIQRGMGLRYRGTRVTRA